ncbi:MAG: hypothetical protein ACQEWU_07525 [Bacillota bacterium]
MNTEKEIQKILKTKHLKGPQFRLNDQGTIGINYVSGNQGSAFYELYGKGQIYQLVILKPSNEFYVNHYVGKKHLVFLLVEEEEQLRGGFVSTQNTMQSELENVFSHLNEEEIKEVFYLWDSFVKEHYFDEMSIEEI